MRVLILLSVVGVVFGRQAPHADVAQEFMTSYGPRFSDNIREDARLDAPGLIAKYGYPVQVHNVITSDGYILETHRIPHGRGQSDRPGRPVVFLMHGLFSSSADYVVLGPGNALAYFLADAGYDVWMGNARGNFYSRQHVTLDPNNIDFWQFSWDEIGNHDLPSMIDYILAVTGQSRLHYVGHSQGGTTFAVLNSLRPEYNDKFISFQGLSPAVFFEHVNNPMFSTFAPHVRLIEAAANRLGIAEILGNNDLFSALGINLCTEESLFNPACVHLWANILQADLNYFNATMVPLIMSNAPAGAALRQLSHYAQCINNKTFRRFNFDPITNRRLYGSFTPPNYDLSKVTVPSYIYYGLSDREVNFNDIYLLNNALPNVAELIQVSRPSFNHYDFVWGVDVMKLVYEKVLLSMRESEL